MNAELPWQQRQCALVFDEVERLLKVNWHDVGRHVVLNYISMEGLVLMKNSSSPNRRYFGFKASYVLVKKDY